MSDYNLKAYLMTLSNDELHELVGNLSIGALKDLYDAYAAWSDLDSLTEMTNQGQ